MTNLIQRFVMFFRCVTGRHDYMNTVKCVTLTQGNRVCGWCGHTQVPGWVEGDENISWVDKT